MRTLLLASLGALTLVACSAPPAAAPTVDVSGTWRAVVLSPGAAYIDDGLEMSLNQQGAAVTGELRVPYTYLNGVPDTYERFGSLSGSVAGDHLNLFASGDGAYAGRTISLSATVGRNYLSGNLTLNRPGSVNSYALTGQRTGTP